MKRQSDTPQAEMWSVSAAIGRTESEPMAAPARNYHAPPGDPVIVPPPQPVNRDYPDLQATIEKNQQRLAAIQRRQVEIRESNRKRIEERKPKKSSVADLPSGTLTVREFLHMVFHLRTQEPNWLERKGIK